MTSVHVVGDAVEKVAVKSAIHTLPWSDKFYVVITIIWCTIDCDQAHKNTNGAKLINGLSKTSGRIETSEKLRWFQYLRESSGMSQTKVSSVVKAHLKLLPVVAGAGNKLSLDSSSAYLHNCMDAIRNKAFSVQLVVQEYSMLCKDTRHHVRNYSTSCKKLMAAM